MDHQPARGVMEGEIRRSTSPPTPQAASLLPPISATCMVPHCADWGGVNVTLGCFPTASCPPLAGEAAPKSSFSVEMPAWVPSMSQSLALYIWLPFFHSLKISQSHYVSPPHPALVLCLRLRSRFSSPALRAPRTNSSSLHFKAIIDVDSAVMTPSIPVLSSSETSTSPRKIPG